MIHKLLQVMKLLFFRLSLEDNGVLIRVQTEDFDITDLYAQLRQQSPNIGSIVTFTGLVRDFQQKADNNKVTALTLEHYPGMTEKSLQEIAQQAKDKWQLDNVIIIHRVGTLVPSEQIVFVGTCSAHREHSFFACQYIMDFLKTSAPFWKKEQTLQGAQWIETKDSDKQATQGWVKK